MSRDRGLAARVDVLRRSARAERLRARAPRYAFTFLVVVLSLLGLRQLIGTHERAPAPAGGPPVDRAMEEFAQRFARAYLTFDAARPTARERALAAIVPEDLELDAGLVTATGSQQVLWTQVAQNQNALAGGRVIVVAAGVTTQARPLYLAVPVMRGAHGALTLTGYPALVGPPSVSRAELGEREEVEDPEILTVARRVVTNYLAGAEQNLAADLSERAEVSLPTRALRVASIDDVAWARGPESGAVLVTATARDAQRVTWTLAYELGIELRGGRPYVSFVETLPNDP